MKNSSLDISESSSPALSRVGAVLQQGRQSAGLSYRQLSELTGYSKGQLHGYEHGSPRQIPPTVLAKLAEALKLPLHDLYEAAGYELPTELPSFAPYLRSKYRTLPPAAKAELEQSFKAIADKYGYDPDGPQPGQDEI